MDKPRSLNSYNSAVTCVSSAIVGKSTDLEAESKARLNSVLSGRSAMTVMVKVVRR